MSKVNVEIPHRLSREEARNRIQNAAPRLENEYSAVCQWEGESRLVVTRKGLKAALDIEDTCVRVAIELGFLLGPLGNSIRAGIVRQLSGLLS
jgi:putative polyhydroxyalkanoate system protein